METRTGQCAALILEKKNDPHPDQQKINQRFRNNIFQSFHFREQNSFTLNHDPVINCSPASTSDCIYQEIPRRRYSEHCP